MSTEEVDNFALKDDDKEDLKIPGNSSYLIKEAILIKFDEKYYVDC